MYLIKIHGDKFIKSLFGERVCSTLLKIETTNAEKKNDTQIIYFVAFKFKFDRQSISPIIFV